MKLLLIAAILSSLLSARAAGAPAHVVIMTVEDRSNDDAVNSMRGFAEKELRPLGYRVTHIEGDKPEPTHFAGLIDARKGADLLVLFVRRGTPLKDQLDAVRAPLDAGKPRFGIRTANHAFIPKKPVQDARPIGWTRPYDPNEARIFYTSLGHPDDMPQPAVRRLLLNAVAWTLGK